MVRRLVRVSWPRRVVSTMYGNAFVVEKWWASVIVVRGEEERFAINKTIPPIRISSSFSNVFISVVWWYVRVYTRYIVHILCSIQCSRPHPSHGRQAYLQRLWTRFFHSAGRRGDRRPTRYTLFTRHRYIILYYNDHIHYKPFVY